MTRVLLISDTHGYLDPGLEKHIASADEVWHAGDIGNDAVKDALSAKKPLRAVHGNIDGQGLRLQFPETLVFSLENVRFMIHHIGGTPGRYSKTAEEKIIQEKPDVFICGHSHILKVMRDPAHSLLFINPGACGQHGFHHMKTAIDMHVNDGKITAMNVIELGKRSQIKP